MRGFEYRRAADSAEAFTLLRGVREAREGQTGAAILAGGTDLIPLLKDGVISPGRLVDIKRARDLDGAIRATPDGISIGALATLEDIAGDPLLEAQAPLLGQAARVAATPQLRAVATIAGNLLQRPRCWYFRHPAFRCWLQGGDDCPAREGRNDLHAILPGGASAASPCCAVHPSDLAPCLVALDAEVLLRDDAGAERLVAVADLFQAPTPQRRRETLLDDELVTEIRLPTPAQGSVTAYDKAMSRRTWSFALAAVAARLDLERGRIAGARVVLGGVAGRPWRAREAETVLVGASPSEALFRRAADAALQDAQALAHNGYKIPLARALVARTLSALARNADPR